MGIPDSTIVQVHITGENRLGTQAQFFVRGATLEEVERCVKGRMLAEIPMDDAVSCRVVETVTLAELKREALKQLGKKKRRK